RTGLHHRLHAGRRRRTHPARPVLPQGHRRGHSREVGTMAAVTPLLATRSLTRAFGGLTAVDHVDFELEEGEIRAVIGPNGAGKTTFVSLVCGRIRPSSGTVVFAGEDVSHLPAHRRVRRGIAYTF